MIHQVLMYTFNETAAQHRRRPTCAWALEGLIPSSETSVLHQRALSGTISRIMAFRPQSCPVSLAAGYGGRVKVGGTLSRTVSPRKSWRVSMVVGFSATTELSSFTASSTYSRLAAFLRSRMAVGAFHRKLEIIQDGKNFVENNELVTKRTLFWEALIRQFKMKVMGLPDDSHARVAFHCCSAHCTSGTAH